MLQFATPICSALLLSAVAASAQTSFHFGVRGGLNRALTTVDAAGTQDNRPAYAYSSSKSAIYTWQAGAVAEVSFGKISLQPALVFAQKGERFQSFIEQGDLVYASSATTGTTRSNWLELPLNVVYTRHRDHGLQVFAGPYVALAVGGRQNGTVDAQGMLIYTQPREFNDALSYGSGTTNRRLDARINLVSASGKARCRCRRAMAWAYAICIRPTLSFRLVRITTILMPMPLTTASYS